MNSSILQVRDLRVHFYTRQGVVRAVNGVSVDLNAGERLGLVGESGSGKSTAALALMRLIKPPGKIEGGQVLLDGLSLLELPEERMRRIRLAEIALVSQGAMNSLNPVTRVRRQIEDALRDHNVKLTPRERTEWIDELLQRVGLPRTAAEMYPHELSGGMKQRVCIAIAICLRPKVIIADEPTSALDVVVQHEVMQTLEALRADLGASIILIGHDMGLMAQTVDRLGVMYAGDLVETGDIEALFSEPLHPYTRLLMASLPSLERKETAKGIPGLMPSLLDRPKGCPFHPRCPDAFDRCKVEEPKLQRVRPNRDVACHLHWADSPGREAL
ncbi:MAG: ATP-binding cassette domain-containing protein [Anaerolineae bacterium]|nr:ATP-binding cassette domain-containing protein [Anaerolineae bacterium]